MANHITCASTLTDDLADLIKNEEAKLKGTPLSDLERMQHIQEVVRKMKANEKMEIIVQAEQLQALKNKLDEGVNTYSNKWLKVNYSDALLSLIQTNTKSSNGARLNLEQTAIALNNNHLGILSSELNQIEHYRTKGDLDVSTEDGARLNTNIMKERARLNGAETPPTGDKIAVEYAKALNNAKRKIENDYKLSGFDTTKKKGYVGEQTHNRTQLMSEGFDNWYNNLLETANLTESNFLNNRKIALNVYKYLIGDSSAISLRETPLSMKESLKRFIDTREITFKTIDDEISYANTFGNPTSEMLKLGSTIDRMAKKTAERNIFGINPQKTLSQLIDYANSKSDKPVKASKIYDVYDEVMGNIQVGNEAFARSGSNIRKLVSTTLFGGTVINSPMPDRMNRAFLEFSTNGKLGELFFNLTKAVPESVKDTGEILLKGIGFKRKGGLTKEETVHLNNVGIGANAILSYSNRFFDEMQGLGAGSGFSKIIDGTNKIFGKISFLETLDNIQTKSNYTILARDAYTSISKNNWDKLTRGERLKFTRYGITEQDYNALSKLTKGIEYDPILKEKVLSPLEVRNLTSDDLKTYIEPQIKEVSDFKKATGLAFTPDDVKIITDKAKFDLETKLRTLYNGESHIALGKRDSRSNFFTRGTKAGTVGGEATRFFSQAKSFPLLYVDNIIKNIYYSTAIETSEKWAGFVAFASYSFLAGYLLEQVSEIRNNRTPKSFDSEMIVRALTRSGIAGLYGDALNSGLSQVLNVSKSTGYQTKAQLTKEILSFAGGPTISKTADLLEGVNNLLAKKPNADKMTKAIRATIPANNLWYINGTLSYLTMAISEGMGGKGLTNERRRLRKQEGFFEDSSRELLFDPLY